MTFLYYAKGSAGEVRSICHVMDRLDFLAHLKSDIADIKSRAESISKQLSAWASSVQGSDISGQRYLTETSRAAYEQKKRAETLAARLRREHEERLDRMKARPDQPE